MRRAICQPTVLCSVFVLFAACAGPRAVGPPAPTQSLVTDQPVAAAADAPPALIAAEPTVAASTVRLATATDAGRPAALLERARASMAAAQALRKAKMVQWELIPPEDEAKYVAYYALAVADCGKVLTRYPSGPEAAEAQFTLGEIHDYPHLTVFSAADEEYSRTIERYPGTPAAQKAVAALRRIREYLGDPGLPPPPKP